MICSETLHAGLVAKRTLGFWRGALIEGPSGSGKSDLTLRALAAGFRLVADDRTIVFACRGRLFGRAAAPLTDLLEVRALDVIRETAVSFCEIAFAVRCLTAGERAPRLFDPLNQTRRCGILVPFLALDPFESSSGLKLAAALDHLGARPQGEYQAPRSRGGSPSRRRARAEKEKPRL
ncbi:MAG: HPr kinase/phosphorylase [Caulobacteraceae bacterium]